MKDIKNFFKKTEVEFDSDGMFRFGMSQMIEATEFEVILISEMKDKIREGYEPISLSGKRVLMKIKKMVPTGNHTLITIDDSDNVITKIL